ncbi:MAG: hypothetical protein M1812_006545 [Candelaria pacifica]|nr:MAG: hypothetical protein M1812_006545 [Candelaria pacifica]
MESISSSPPSPPPSSPPPPPPPLPPIDARRAVVQAWITDTLVYHGFDRAAARKVAERQKGHIGVLRTLTVQQAQIKFGNQAGAVIHDAVFTAPPTPAPSSSSTLMKSFSANDNPNTPPKFPKITAFLRKLSCLK